MKLNILGDKYGKKHDYEKKYKYKIINDITIKKISKHQAKNKLNLTIRRINQLIQIFNKEGKTGFIHKSRNRISNKATKIKIKNEIINLYKTKYYKEIIPACTSVEEKMN